MKNWAAPLRVSPFFCTFAKSNLTIMQVYQIWLIAAIVLVIVEILTAGFGSVCFAVGAGLAALAAGLGLSITWQIIIFAAVSLLTFIFLRPIVMRFLDKKSKDVRTNAEALIGRKAVVSERIDASQHTGRVAIDGDDWKAVSVDGSVIEKGTEVEILKLDSIILTVKS
jgi:membrane protein implicated in regulation of membrane protease activity